jgi:hypothetical protein
MKGMIGLIVGCLAVNVFYIVPAIGQANRIPPTWISV